LNASRLLGISGSSACLSAFLAETRSSTVLTATLKDFALGQFNTCGSITINKVTVPATDTTTQFGFTATGTGLDPTFSLTGGGPPNPSSTVTYVDLNPCQGTECYVVTENNPSGSGYALTDLTCQAAGTSTFTIDKPNRTASINLSPSDSVACTYTNTKFGKIVVDKVTQPSGDPTSFSYTTTGTGYAGFSLKDTDTPNDSGPLTPGAAYTVTEGAVQGWVLSDLQCTSSLGTSTITKDQANRKVTVNPLGAGDTVNCTYTNTLKFRVAVIVCTNEAVPQFHPSSVTVGGVGPKTSANSGTASTLCTSAANFNNVTPGTKNLSVTIQQNSPNTP
jgi:hypothetical protein